MHKYALYAGYKYYICHARKLYIDHMLHTYIFVDSTNMYGLPLRLLLIYAGLALGAERGEDAWLRLRGHAREHHADPLGGLPEPQHGRGPKVPSGQRS